MKSVKIKLSTIADVRDFVNIVSKSDTEIDLTSGRYVVDGKSIMGIFSVDLTKPLHVIAHCEEDDGISAQIEPYVYVAEKK